MLKQIILIAAAMTLTGLTVAAQSALFLPKHLAVLRAGDGVLDLNLKQSPIFIDQYAPGMLNDAPSLTVKIPTNGPDTLFFNGHAATEGILTLSADHRLLAFAGYGGTDLLATQGTPSLLDFKRGFCTVDAGGQIQTFFYRQHGGEDEKMNPRGVVTDGYNNFWGCGNALGTVYYNPTGAVGTVNFIEVPTTRSIKIINHVLYTTLNNADATASDLPAGIFGFADKNGAPVALPQSTSTTLQPVVRAQASYAKIAGFDMNPEGTIAYTADVTAGIQKYVKSGDTWKFAYNFAIPQNIPADDNHQNGCFGLAVDFSGSAPVIYATTTEGYDGCVNSNRVVQIVDTSAQAAVTTVAQAHSSSIAFRGIALTPGTP
ncbi:MAG TPA: hypothetical protein VNZ25_01185 [Candidatus Angelobacter sp.]|nr:hypothetical protein [Candidatus Angelobacter sp.]